jgi:hypothetical protein
LRLALQQRGRQSPSSSRAAYSSAMTSDKSQKCSETALSSSSPR